MTNLDLIPNLLAYTIAIASLGALFGWHLNSAIQAFRQYHRQARIARDWTRIDTSVE